MTPPSVRIDEARSRELWHSLGESCVQDVLHTPLGLVPALVALVAAAAAPFVVGALQASLETSRRRRTAALIERALATLRSRAGA
jgi:hypothetical protein